MTAVPSLSRAAVRALDRRAIEEYGIPSAVLMENAGRACVEHLLPLREESDSRAVLVLCGPGNNGGDGLVIARTLANREVPVRAVFTGHEERLARCSEDVRTNARLWTGLGRVLEFARSDEEFADLGRSLSTASVLVDALFGTGLTRALRSPFDELVRALNDSGRPILAVDVPSGLDADTGEILGEAVRATTTVTFVAPKLGFERAHGPALCGRVHTAEIGIPRAWLLACADS